MFLHMTEIIARIGVGARSETLPDPEINGQGVEGR